MRKLLGIILIIVAIVVIPLAFYFDVTIMTIPGAQEVYYGWITQPQKDISRIVWGIVRIAFSGVFLILGFILAVICGTSAFAILSGKPRNRQRKFLGVRV
jgi:hypothetical protein